MKLPFPERRSLVLVVAALALVGIGAAASGYVCLTLVFPSHFARELELPSERTVFGLVDVVLPGGRGGGCDSLLISPLSDQEELLERLHGWSSHKPSAHCVIRALGDKGEIEAIGPMLAYALTVYYVEVPTIAATTAAALVDIGGPLVHKTALALTTSDNGRLALIGLLVLKQIATAKERAYLWSLHSEQFPATVDRDRLLDANLWATYREWGLNDPQCGTYGCAAGWQKTRHPTPLTADD